MIRSFLIIALRFFWRNKTYTVLNYLCLTFGLTCSIIAVLHIKRVVSYDRFHENYSRLYKVAANVTFFNGSQFPKELLSVSLAEKLKEGAPEIESLTRVTTAGFTLASGDKSFGVNGVYADDNFLGSFTFPLISGPATGKIPDIGSVFITEGMAMKYFETADCIGKTLVRREGEKNETYTVAGVLKDLPSQSYMKFDVLIPFERFLAEKSYAGDPGPDATQIWALLHRKSDRDVVNGKIHDLIKNQEATLNQELFLIPLSEQVLYRYVDGRRTWAEMQYVVLIGSIGLAILLIACFNFINLSIALNIRRYHEAGIKKVLGVRRPTIILHYLSESFLLILVSFITAADLVNLLVNKGGNMFTAGLEFTLNDIGIILIFISIAMFTGLISGLMPAIYLSSSNPVSILKGKITKSHSFSGFRQGLIIFQFTIPIILLILMMIIKTQDRFMNQFDIGFEKEHLIILNNTGDLAAHEESFRADLMSVPGIESISFTNCIPTRGARVTNDVGWDGRDALEKPYFWCINADFSFDRTVSIKMSEGRYFNRSFPSDSACYVINDVAARVMRYEDPIGKSITIDGRKGTIVGVFTGFHTLDLAGPFTPTVISVNGENRDNILISFNSGNARDLYKKIEPVYKKYETAQIFHPVLFSDIRNRELNTTSNVVGGAFVLAILLACMGLSGLASFTAESRTKEIGIRRANGASIFSIVRMLGGNFTKWIAIATLISLPFAFMLGMVFLGRFNFRTTMPWWVFTAGPLTAWIIALLSVSLQSWRAAARNPVESLRYE